MSKIHELIYEKPPQVYDLLNQESIKKFNYGVYYLLRLLSPDPQFSENRCTKLQHRSATYRYVSLKG